jgi:capsid protein
VKLFLLDQYDDAELDRKKVAAMYAMFVTSPAPENPLAPAEDEDCQPGSRSARARSCGSIRARM